MKNMHDLDGVGSDAIENQIIAEWTSADADMFVTRYQRIAARRERKASSRSSPTKLSAVAKLSPAIYSAMVSRSDSASAVRTTIRAF